MREYDIQNSFIGRAPKNFMRNQNGLDEIDLEAMSQGMAVRRLKEIRPTRLRNINKVPAFN